jgi:hypothetical protein
MNFVFRCVRPHNDATTTKKKVNLATNKRRSTVDQYSQRKIFTHKTDVESV